VEAGSRACTRRPRPRPQITAELGYLRSYENMGRAAVRCEGGCKCEPWTLDGHHESRTSQTFLTVRGKGGPAQLLGRGTRASGRRQLRTCGAGYVAVCKGIGDVHVGGGRRWSAVVAQCRGDVRNRGWGRGGGSRLTTDRAALGVQGFKVSQADDCIVVVTVLQVRATGEAPWGPQRPARAACAVCG
jgi:hypothetical protein